MGFLSNKIRRAREATDLIWSYAGNLRTAQQLCACYASLLRQGAPDRDTDLELTIGRGRFSFRMRHSDIFTLAEILHERQYQVTSPLPDRPLVIDAGANIGVTAVWFLGHYPGATVHCFEPSAANFGYLSANVGTIAGVHAIRAALGREAGVATLHLADHGAMHSVVSESTDKRSEAVPRVALAEYLASHAISRVDLLKLDVEGSELEVLLGLGERIDDVRVIIGEVHERVVEPAAFYDYLTGRGFQVLWRRDFASSRVDGVHGFEAARLR